MENKRSMILVVSLVLGVTAALLNFLYLSEKGKEVESIAFVGIADGAEVHRGDTFQANDLVEVKIPKNRVGALGDFAVLWSAQRSVIGEHATRSFQPGELLLRADLKTPPPELELGADEVAMGIPVDTRTFVPTLVTPGDQVWFVISAGAVAPTPAGVDVEESGPPVPTPPAAIATGAVETIGPFRVLSLGNRLGSSDVMRAAGIPQVQENVMMISVRKQGDQFEPKAQKLWSLVQATGLRQVGVVLHPRKK